MRILAAIMFAVLVLGGMAAYVRFADSITPKPIDLSHVEASGKFAVDVTLTFDVAASTFAGFDEYGLQIRLADQVLLNSGENISAGTPVRIDDVKGVRVGVNEFWVFAAPAADGSRAGDETESDLFAGFEAEADRSGSTGSASVDRAIRVRVFRDVEVVAEETIWSQDDAAVQGTVILSVMPEALIEGVSE